jgi:hypothetical protein
MVHEREATETDLLSTDKTSEHNSFAPVQINMLEEEKGTESSNDSMRGAAINWLEAEPDFLYEGELSEEQEHRIQSNSRFGRLHTWRLVRLMVKSGDDLRLEQFAMQLI